MQEIRLGPVKLADGLSYTFPTSRCPNCGSTRDLTQASQATRVSPSFFIFGGTELTFHLNVASCAACAPSLKRRFFPLSNKILVAVLISGAIAAALLLVITLGSISLPIINNYPFIVSALLGATTAILYFSSHRFAPPQTSYYQPIRITAIKRDFLDGTVRRIRFAFTNRDYARDFRHQNRVAIQAGFLEVTDA